MEIADWIYNIFQCLKHGSISNFKTNGRNKRKLLKNTLLIKSWELKDSQNDCIKGWRQTHRLHINSCETGIEIETAIGE